ncbi:flagellar basal body protein FliL, partial [Campylobacter coli]|nr:flagellar basal body protein FliL [Campylobacter coli]
SINYFFICMHFILYYIYYLFLLNKPSKSIRQGNFSYNFHTSYFYSLDPFILNLPQAGRQKYIHCTIDLELIKEISLEDFTKISPVIRDTIIQTILAKEIQEIEFSNFKLELQRELVKKINEKLGNKLIKELYFRDFIIS